MEQAQYKTSDLIIHPERMDGASAEWLRKLVDRYPYYQTARLLLLENLYRNHDEAFDAELRRSALILADRSVLFNLVEGENYNIPDQAVSESKSVTDSEVDRTFSLIKGYLDALPFEENKNAPAHVDPASDYAAFIMQQEENSEQPESEVYSLDEQVEDVFTSDRKKTGKSKSVISLPEKPVGETMQQEEKDQPKEEFYTETLAQIFIKQKKYERALEIIKALDANNPKKSRYFADQIRFLEQLIAINHYK